MRMRMYEYVVLEPFYQCGEMVQKGELLRKYIGITYGCISPEGVAVNRELGDPFFEAPRCNLLELQCPVAMGTDYENLVDNHVVLQGVILDLFHILSGKDIVLNERTHPFVRRFYNHVQEHHCIDLLAMQEEDDDV